MVRALCAVSLLVLTLSSVGCSTKTPDRALYEAIAPEYTAYVQKDETLTEEQRERRLRTVDAWSIAVNKGGK